mgnify:CR=1 FL=1
MNIPKAILAFTALLSYAFSVGWVYLSGFRGFETHCVAAFFLAAGVIISILLIRGIKAVDVSAAADKPFGTAVTLAGAINAHEMENVCLGLFERESAVEISRISAEFLSSYFSLEGAAVISYDETKLCKVLAAKGIPEDLVLSYWEEIRSDLPDKVPVLRSLAYRPYLKTPAKLLSGRITAAVYPLVCRNVILGYIVLFRCGEIKKFNTPDLNGAGRFGRYLAAALALAQARSNKAVFGAFHYEAV